MTLAAGTCLGVYEITSLLGKGGMGEVYRASDTKLGREVAIKTLAAELANEPERLARLEREARSLAAINHANIASIYQLEEHDGTQFLVLELVEGETLAERLQVGPFRIEEALDIARQIGAALEAAHERGVIHRDLKPANVMITAEGIVKVLDFGLAKSVTTPAGGADELTKTAQTKVGTVLGTAPYMSPEQTRGEAADRQSDIWAFGVVLYEMLTGTSPFAHESAPETLARVLVVEPDFAALPAGLPTTARHLLRRCLEKERRRRLRDAGDLRIGVEDAIADLEQTSDDSARARTRSPRQLAGAIAMLMLGAVVTALVAWGLRPEAPPPLVNRFTYTVPEDHPLRYRDWDPVSLSPDGRRLVYNTNDGLYIREMDALEARLIPGTSKPVHFPRFSPDSRSLLYRDQLTGALERIAITGGRPVVVADGAGDVSTLIWGDDNTFLFINQEGLFRVPAEGDAAELLVETADGELLTRAELLPDGDAVLLTVVDDVEPDWNQAQVVAVSLATRERTVLVEGGADAHYLPTGHLVYAAGTELFAIAFDADALSVSGEPVRIADGVFRSLRTGSAHYGFAADGTLAYLSDNPGAVVPVWVDRSGNLLESLPSEQLIHLLPRISPDGSRLAITIIEGRVQHIWVYDLVRGGPPQRITREPDVYGAPVWTPDSRSVVYPRGTSLFRRAADGSGAEVQVATLPDEPRLMQMMSNGEDLLLQVPWNGVSSDLYTFSLAQTEAVPEPLLAEEHTEALAALSPNGRWLVYTSDETGRNEIYVSPYPNVHDGKSKISTNGGQSPHWSSNGQELFYRNGDDVIAVPVATEPGFEHESPQTLFTGNYYAFEVPRPNWDVHPDGQRFLMLDSLSNGIIVVVQNARQEIARLVASR